MHVETSRLSKILGILAHVVPNAARAAIVRRRGGDSVHDLHLSSFSYKYTG
jgi:hypothetical protein